MRLPPPALVAYRGREEGLDRLPTPLPLDRLAPGRAPWELELGFGKGAYLLARAGGEAETARFLGVEMASMYYRRVRDRVQKRGLANVVLVRGEALFVLATALPRGFARRVHVYFPDPWPKSRHHKRRLLDPESVDLVLGALEPGGVLRFATDHPDYGEAVVELLAAHGGLEVRRRPQGWADGPATHYEAKYRAAGREIVRCEARLRGPAGALHPAGRRGVVAAVRPPRVEGEVG